MVCANVACEGGGVCEVVGAWAWSDATRYVEVGGGVHLVFWHNSDGRGWVGLEPVSPSFEEGVEGEERAVVGGRRPDVARRGRPTQLGCRSRWAYLGLECWMRL